MSEFALKGGSVVKGAVAAVAGAVMYVAIPLALIFVLISVMPELEGADVAEQLRLHDIMAYVLMAGIPLAVLSFFRGYYPKGSYSRAAIGAGTGALLGLWVWLVALEGRLVLEFEDFGASVDYSGFVYLLLLLAALKGTFYVVEMFSYRKEWLGAQEAPRPAEGGAVAP